MDVFATIAKSPQWQAFQQQLNLLIGTVQDTNIRVRRLEQAVEQVAQQTKLTPVHLTQPEPCRNHVHPHPGRCQA